MLLFVRMSNDTKDKIVEAATELFCTLSYHKVSTRLIAQKAGCAHSLLHRHWSSKEELFVDVLRSARTELFTNQAKHIYPGMSLAAGVTKSLYARNERIFILLRHFLGNEDFGNVLDEYLKDSPLPLDDLPNKKLKGVPEIDRDSILTILIAALIVPFDRLVAPYIGEGRAAKAQDNVLHAIIRLAYHVEEVER